MDADGDEELSFSDFFSSLLPYFIYGDLRQPPTTNELASKAILKKQKSDKNHRKTLNIQVKRNKSASATQRRKPPVGEPGFWEKNRRLLDDDEGFLQEEDYVGLRDAMDINGLSQKTAHQMRGEISEEK